MDAGATVNVIVEGAGAIDDENADSEGSPIVEQVAAAIAAARRQRQR